MRDAFQPEDIFLYQSLGQLHCSADTAAFVVKTIDRAADTYRSTIWTVPFAGGAPRQFTRGTDADGSPGWSPDGTQLGFISTREGGVPQVHLIARDGGEARRLTGLEEGVASFDWSPDGKRLLVASARSVDPDARGQGHARHKPRPVDAPELAWRLPYKSDGLGYLLGREIDLFVVDVASGTHTGITEGPFDVLGAAWSPDGRRIAFTRTREGREAHRTDVWIMDADGRNARQLTHDIASTQSPSFSPDGRRIVFAGGSEEGGAQLRLYLLELDGGEARPLLREEVEIAAAGNVHWAGDGSRVFFVAARRGCHAILSAAVPDGRLSVLVEGERQVSELVCAGDRIAFLAEGLAQPCELFTVDWSGGGEARLTDFNAWWRERVAFATERRQFEVPDGRGGRERIEGWLLRPQGASGATPLLVDVHGGPTSYAMLGFPWHAYWNVLLSRGWSILAPHPVGSSSFGREFAERLNGHWGELDFPQHLAAVDALRRDGVADDRLAIAGKSYGGYLSAWAIGHTGRFRAAVVSAPVANLESHFGTSDGGYYSDPYTLRGERHVERDRFRELSPVQHAHNATTPTLILQGKEDQRCPRGQAEELFAVLMRGTQVPVEMVLYPGGDHHFFEQGKPSHRLDVLLRMVAWLERWVETPGNPQEGGM